MTSAEFLPLKSSFNQQENSKQKDTQITFFDDGQILSVRKQVGKDEQVLKFNPGNFTLDPFSAAFLARSLDWHVGETKRFDTFNGKTRYLIDLTADELVQMKVNGEVKDVWVISPRVTNLTAPKANGKLRSAKIYVTADSSRDILQIVSSVFVGSVTTKLKSYEPAQTLTTTQVAQNPKKIFFE